MRSLAAQRDSPRWIGACHVDGLAEGGVGLTLCKVGLFGGREGVGLVPGSSHGPRSDATRRCTAWRVLRVVALNRHSRFCRGEILSGQWEVGRVQQHIQGWHFELCCGGLESQLPDEQWD